jgi:hypothetical protein
LGCEILVDKIAFLEGHERELLVEYQIEEETIVCVFVVKKIGLSQSHPKSARWSDPLMRCRYKNDSNSAFPLIDAPLHILHLGARVDDRQQRDLFSQRQ